MNIVTIIIIIASSVTIIIIITDNVIFIFFTADRESRASGAWENRGWSPQPRGRQVLWQYQRDGPQNTGEGEAARELQGYGRTG